MASSPSVAESNVSDEPETNHGGGTQGNIWKKGDISAFQGKCKKQQVHNGHFGRYEMRQCLQTSGFALISLPRKFIICSSVPDSCTVAFKGKDYDFLFLSSVWQHRTPAFLQPWPRFANRPARAMHLLNHCVHLEQFLMLSGSHKTHTPLHFLPFRI